MKVSREYKIYYLSKFPFAINFDKEYLDSQSDGYIDFLYNRCQELEEKIMG